MASVLTASELKVEDCTEIALVVLTASVLELENSKDVAVSDGTTAAEVLVKSEIELKDCTGASTV